ncbi:MAG: hypothetical protein H6810_03660 [Phycisphaeraceae bacterium]|nr:MAG: hypothetical protein H6810_03660 [Phycisphaeraceae bacterium]
MKRFRTGIPLALAAAMVGVLAAAAPIGALAFTATAIAEPDDTAQATLDKLILRNGKVIEGTIIRETTDKVYINVVVGNLSAQTVYEQADILQIIHGDQPAEADAEPGDADQAQAGDTPRSEAGGEAASSDAPSVYLINLEGQFGRDISPTPVRDAMEAAEKEQPDFLIVYLNNKWGDLFSELPNDYQDNFDWFMVAEKIVPIFTREIDLNWEKKPSLVFWVRNAMGGAAFLPWVADEIYMHPEGRIGGVGTLEKMFEGVGDEIVRQKQRSLRLGMAQGVAIAGGYDYRLITAMARKSYVASYDIYGNIYERMPENPGEEVLTDDGKDKNQDTMQQLITGEGNDVLTLKPRTALQLGVSKGTAKDLDEVLEHLGILRNHRLIEGRSNDIMDDWHRNVARAERKIPKLWQEFNEVQVSGTVREQTQALSHRISILKEMQDLYRRYGEAFNPFAGGVPRVNQLDMMIEQINIQITLLKA